MWCISFLISLSGFDLIPPQFKGLFLGLYLGTSFKTRLFEQNYTIYKINTDYVTNISWDEIKSCIRQTRI